MKTLITFFVERGLLVNLLSGMLLLGGIYAGYSIQREAFPSVNFDLVVVSAVYPGASPHEMEQLLTIPIERELKGIDGVKTFSSTSSAGSMELSIEIDPNYDDRSRFVADVQQAIDRADLPDDLPTDPVLVEVKSEQTPVLSFSIFGPIDELELKHFADRIEDDLLAIRGVSKVFVQGDRKEEIRITLDPERMHRHHVSTGDIIRLVRGWNVNAPGGDLQTPGGQKVIRVNGEFTSAADAANLVIRANELGDALLLKDVADVTQTLERPRRHVDAMGDPAMNFIVIKQADADIIQLVDRVRAYLPTIPERYHEAIQTRAYQDFSINTRLRLKVLTSNGAIGLLFVFLTLFMFLRPAVAMTTAWGLPIIFFSGILVLYMSGTTLNLLTMFGFIVVLGLMVDDAIIIGENATWHMEQGLSPAQAAIEGTHELVGPVTATVLTTVVAFLPLMFMEGIIGKFVFSIPLVVVVLLTFSWLEAIFILPNHVRDVVNPDKHPRERRLLIWLTDLYERLLRIAVRFRYLTIALSIAGLIGAGMLAGQIKFQLFPSGAEDQFYLRVTAPVGTTLDEMRQQLLAIDREVRARIDPALLETTTTMAGMNSADEREDLKQIGDHFGFVRVILTSFVERTTSAKTVMAKLEKEIPALFPAMEVSFVMRSPGPPTGRALQVEIRGSSNDTRERAARRLVTLLEGVEGVHSIESGLQPGDPEIHIVLDRALATYAQVDMAAVATHIRAAFDGLPVSTLKQGKEEIDVTIRYPEKARTDIGTLKALLIPNQAGGLVPLGKIATFVERPGVTNVRHKDGLRIINVSAEVHHEKITSAGLNALVKAKESEWLGDDAKLLRYRLGGEQERTEESVQGLIFSFIFALLGIFIILAVQFNRLSYPLLVMLAIPFGVIGIVVGLFLHGQPVSFMSLMGFVALTGVVVNASLVMAVFIQRLLNEGMPWFESIIHGGKRRLRAVLLTAITTVVGLLPTAYGWGGFDPFVAPMALALSWGLMFSTAITLFSVPAALGIGMDCKHFAEGLMLRLRGKHIPGPDPESH
ncbi:MAG: efflux RND transporter permease subunit [Mariprofundaceae bacterium]